MNVPEIGPEISSEVKNPELLAGEIDMAPARTEEYLATIGNKQSTHHLMINARRDELWESFTKSLGDIHREFPGLVERAVREVVLLKYPQIKWARLEARLEGWIEKHSEWTPNRVAGMALYYFKMDSRMRPFLIATAQRIKNRVRMRKKRQEEGAWPTKPEFI